MTDPFDAPFFDALREPGAPVDPDPYFAEALRQRLTRHVFASPDVFVSPGGTMSQQTIAAARAVRAPTLNPYIVVSDARRATDWYVEVFGA
jgi:hypothetical protein